MASSVPLLFAKSDASADANGECGSAEETDMKMNRSTTEDFGIASLVRLSSALFPAYMQETLQVSHVTCRSENLLKIHTVG